MSCKQHYTLRGVVLKQHQPRNFLTCPWVFVKGNEDLDLKLPLPEQQAKEKFPENIPVPRPLMQTSGTEFGKEFDEMEAAILTSQDLCAKISHQMGHIKEDKAFLCWGTKLRSSAPVDELARLQKQLLRMKALLPSLRNGIN